MFATSMPLRLNSAEWNHMQGMFHLIGHFKAIQSLWILDSGRTSRFGSDTGCIESDTCCIGFNKGWYRNYSG